VETLEVVGEDDVAMAKVAVDKLVLEDEEKINDPGAELLEFNRLS
jgi:hypothetical protein